MGSRLSQSPRLCSIVVFLLSFLPDTARRSWHLHYKASRSSLSLFNCAIWRQRFAPPSRRTVVVKGVRVDEAAPRTLVSVSADLATNGTFLKRPASFDC